MAPGKILAPVDFTTGSKAAVDYALVLAEALRSSVTLLHVYDRAGVMDPIVPGADRATDEDAAREAALVKLNELRAVLRFAFLDVAVETGDAATAILEYAQRGRFDLIVMGTHGREGLSRLLMGSVAEGVIRRARVPVVTVHFPT